MRGRGAFDDEEDVAQQKSSGDAEFTLGAGMLVLVFGGLLVVCGICFGLGYIAGRRGTASLTAAQQAVETQTSPQTSSSQQKPSAITQDPAVAPSQTESQTESASTNLPQSTAADAGTGSPAQSATPAAGQFPTRQSTPEVTQPTPQATQQPAPQPTPQPMYQAKPQPTQPFAPATRARTSESNTQFASRPDSAPAVSGLWVQVAAVSHVEDAQVLTAALRRRGYLVTPRRESDNLIHVRIGPFNTRDEANRWSMKLLDDGYNAEVQR